MKNTYRYLVIIFVIPLFFTTCKKEDDNPNTITNNTGTNMPFTIGDTYQEGIVFYVDSNNWTVNGIVVKPDIDGVNALIAAPFDQSVDAEFGCQGIFVIGADQYIVGSGSQNTVDIINANCPPSSIGKLRAANLCTDLILGDYSDWFLPSYEELQLMYRNIGPGDALGLGNIGGFDTVWYRSSTEKDNNTAWLIDFAFGSNAEDICISKDGGFNVRAVRAVKLPIYGCLDPIACNYDPLVNTDDGSCIMPDGCTEPTAPNYNSEALCDDGSCLFDGSIGDSYRGGIVFYLDSAGQHGLIAAPYDQSIESEWGCYGYSFGGANWDPSTGTGEIDATSTDIGSGYQNTLNIVHANCSPLTSGYTLASNICSDLKIEGYSDWFLPSRDELIEMFKNIGPTNVLGLGNIGGISPDAYWSSSQFDHLQAWWCLPAPGVPYSAYIQRSAKMNVRAIRSF
tara:strand:- start:85 stop:1443 length:1359 start_codon:yes stop_codon:yes gene_type:complete